MLDLQHEVDEQDGEPVITFTDDPAWNGDVMQQVAEYSRIADEYGPS